MNIAPPWLDFNGGNLIVGRHYRRMFDGIGQFPHISGPVIIIEQGIHGGMADAAYIPYITLP